MIGVIVINYGGPERTIRFVREECAKIASPHKVVVVDNGSGQSCLQTLKSGLDGLAEIIPAGENLGFAKGNNLGAEVAKDRFGADLLLFVNNDIVFTSEDVVDVLAERLAQLPEVGMIGPKVRGLDGRLQSPEPFQSFAAKHLLPYWGKLFMGKSRLAAILQEDYAETAQEGLHYRIMGSFMLMRTADFEACGGMDPNTFLYAEEAILAERLKRLGKGAWYEPSVEVLHEHGATVNSHFSKVGRRRMRLESDAYYYRTYLRLPRLQYLAARLTYALKALFGL